MTSEIKVNTIKKNSGSTITIGETGDTVTIPAGNIAVDGKILISAQDTTRNYLQSKIVAGTNISVTLNGSGSNESITFNATGETKPTISSISPTVITNDASNVVLRKLRGDDGMCRRPGAAGGPASTEWDDTWENQLLQRAHCPLLAL